MPEEEGKEYKIGQKLGGAIVALFEVIAMLDNITYQEAVDEWVAAYVTERITHPD